MNENTELSPDELLALNKRQVKLEELEPLLGSVSKMIEANPISAVLISVLRVPDSDGTAGFASAGVGLSNSLAHCALQSVSDAIEKYPEAKKSLVKELKKIIAEAESTDAPANAN